MTIFLNIVGAFIGYIIAGFTVYMIILSIGIYAKRSVKMPGFRFCVGLLAFVCMIAGAWVGASLG
jgi:hypothetical protein